jgi:hypothetical protein
MFLGNVILQREVTEHAALGHIGTAHRRLPFILLDDHSTTDGAMNSMKSRRISTNCKAPSHAGLPALASRFVDVAALPWESTRFAGVRM